jgi:hypothetical protein
MIVVPLIVVMVILSVVVVLLWRRIHAGNRTEGVTGSWRPSTGGAANLDSDVLTSQNDDAVNAWQ